MSACKPRVLLDREVEWRALATFVERSQRVTVVYGPGEPDVVTVTPAEIYGRY